MKLTTIDTKLFKLDGGAMFGVVPKSLWSRGIEADERNLCTWAMRCLLVEHGDRKLLIDAGLGSKQSDKFFSYYEPHGEDTLLGSLENNGVKPEDITDVLLTHLHFDHCGDAVSMVNGALKTTFPNATYYSNEKHWNWAMKPNARERASFLKENFVPIQEANQLQFIQENEEFFPNIRCLVANGHTEAQLIPKIEVNGKMVVYMADLLPSVHHIPLPYVMGYDIRPLVTLDEKKKFLTEAQQEGYTLFLEHDEANECCTLKEAKGRVKLADTFALSEF